MQFGETIALDIDDIYKYTVSQSSRISLLCRIHIILNRVIKYTPCAPIFYQLIRVYNKLLEIQQYRYRVWRWSYTYIAPFFFTIMSSFKVWIGVIVNPILRDQFLQK